MPPMRDLAGQRFGKLVAVDAHSRSRSGQVRWNVRCDCGTVKDVLGTHLVSGRTRSCGCAKPRGAERRQWTGCGELSGQFWSTITRHARERTSVELSLTVEEAWKLFLAQDRRCALTGLFLTMPSRHGHARTASLDRIDSSQGYVLGNVQWVHKDVNKMKNTYDQGYFLEMCRLVTAHGVAGACEVPDHPSS